jgi:hypothetical protein
MFNGDAKNLAQISRIPVRPIKKTFASALLALLFALPCLCYSSELKFMTDVKMLVLRRKNPTA